MEKKLKSDGAYVPKKTNGALIAVMIVCAVLMILLTIVLPIVFAVMVIFTASFRTDFKVIDENTIEVSNLGMQVSVEKSYYDEDSGCFVLDTKSLIIDKEKYKKIELLNDTISVTYSFLDEDGYMLGSEALFIENLNYEKWKIDVNYCGIHAKEVSSYKVESVDSY